MKSNQYLDRIINGISSRDLIGDSAILVSPNGVHRDKQYILDRIQYWKQFLTLANVGNILILHPVSLDTVAIFYACAELGISVTTNAANNEDEILKKSKDGGNMLFVDSTWSAESVEIFSSRTNIKVSIINEQEIDSTFESNRPVYVQSNITLDNILVYGTTSGTTANPKTVIHSSETFFNGVSIIANFWEDSDVIGAIGTFSHAGVIAMTVFPALMKGLTYYAAENLLQLLTNASKCNKLCLWEWNLNSAKKLISTNGVNSSTLLWGCTVVAGGSTISQRYINEVFALGAKDIISFYGTNEILVAAFKNYIPNKTDNFSSRGLGTPLPEMECKIKNNQILLKSPSTSSYVVLDEYGFFNTTDYGRYDEHGNIHYLGRDECSLPDGTEIYAEDIKKIISAVNDDLLLTEFMLEFEYNEDTKISNLTVYPFSNKLSETPFK